MKRTYARQVVEGSASPRAGAARIIGLLHELDAELPKSERFLGDSFGVSLIVGLYYQLDDAAADDTAVLRGIEDALVAACGRVARGEEANG